MRGVVFDGSRIHVRGDLPRPAAGGETRVRVLKAGVCATDLALARGYMNFRGIPGHEFVGVALNGPLAGRRVVGEINVGCGSCARCRGGLDRHCTERTVLGILGRSGCFAEELSLPLGNLHPLPDSVSDDAAVFVEPLAAAFEIAEQLDLARFERALVAGDGRLGILCAWVLSWAGVRVSVAGRHPERQALLPPETEHFVGVLEREAVLERDSGVCEGAFDLTVEATGSPDVLDRLLTLVRPRGTVVIKTTTERSTEIDTARAVVDELTLIGSRCGPFRPAIEALARADLDATALIDARHPLSEAVQALETASRPGVLKVILDIGT